MQYVNLGRSGVRVSRLILGTMNFDYFATEPESHAIMDKALELGINFFDTANVYGRGPHVVEGIIGRWLAQGGGRRDETFLATKVYLGVGPGPNDKGCSAYHIRRTCEDSLKALQTDHLDLYWMHHYDRRTPWDEIWQAMEQLVREGKIAYVGSSNFAGWHIAHAQHLANERNFLGLVAEQHMFSLVRREPELEVLPACQELGLGLCPYSPLACGLLAGNVLGATSGRRARDLQATAKEMQEQLSQWESLCREIGHEPADVALAWLLHFDGVTGPIIGPRNVEQLAGSLRALEITFTDEMLAKIDKIFPPVGKGGPAPEAYAW